MPNKYGRKLLKFWVVLGVTSCFVLITFLICSAAEQPRRGGTLLVALYGDLYSLNPALTTNTLQVLEEFYEGLVELDRDLNPLPGLADSWEISSDGLTITFHLAKNVEWHDGMPFTSKDVRFSLMEVVAKYQPRGKLVMANVKSIETPDDHTAIFRMNKVYAPLFLGLCANNCPIIPKHLYEGTDILKNPHNFSDPVGTGAFKLKEWAKGDHITLVRNDNYRKPGLPYLDRIIFKVIKDATSRSFAFEKGEVDFLDHENCNYADYKKLSLLPNVTASPPFGGPRVALIAFNQRDNKILANLKIRQAIYHAIDRQFISDKARYGLNPPLDSAIPKSLRDFHNPNVKKYEYNPAEANKLLDEAGYPRGADGIRFSVRLTDIAGIHFTEKAHQIIKSMLREVGIDVKLEVLELSLIIDKVFKKYDFDMFTNSYATGGDPSIGIARAYVSTEIRPAPFVNLARYSNPEVDRLFNEGAASMNRKTRAKAYFKAQEILAEELPYIWLFEHAFDTNLVKSNFKNCFQRVYGPRFNEVWWTGER